MSSPTDSFAAQPLAFITGASSGIGQALAVEFHRRGYRLALVARRGADMRHWAEQQGWQSDRCAVYSADVSDAAALKATAEHVIAQQGLPDVVVANAGISLGVDTAVFDDIAVTERLWATNNLGLMATFHPFVSGMVARGQQRSRRAAGTLVGMGSVAGIRGLPGHGAYCASKAGVIAYCESLRGELRAHGVRVVTLCPGYIDTPLTQQNPYSMPFLMKPADFARQAVDAIEAGDSYRVIPWQMAVVAKLMRGLPNALFDRVFAGRPRKPRHAR